MKWAIREAVDVYFKAKGPFQLGSRFLRADEPVLIFDTVQTSTLEVAAEISYVTGGRGNARILSFEGDKTLTFNFEDALLSNEGLAILSGADLIPARNPRLRGSAPEARTVKTHFTERFAVATANQPDTDTTNQYVPRNRGGYLSVHLSRKPFVGQNGSIYVMLLDGAGEMSGAPLEVNLNNPSAPIEGREAFDSWDKVRRHSHLAKFAAGDFFVAVDATGNPMSVEDYPHPANRDENAMFDDIVAHYVDAGTMATYWNTAQWGNIAGFIRCINATSAGSIWGENTETYLDIDGYVLGHDGENILVGGVADGTVEVSAINIPTVGQYGFLLFGNVPQPKAFYDGSTYNYRVNVPSIMFQDIVLIDYYVEHRRGATQVSILPDKFGPFLYVEGETLVRRASDGVDLPASFVIPRFKVTTALTFTMAATGDASTFNFQGDAYPDFSKFDLTRRVLADIQVVDDTAAGLTGDPTDYRRFHYTNKDGEYLWKDPSLAPHANIDVADTEGPATHTPGAGFISGGGGDQPTPPPGTRVVNLVTTGGSGTVYLRNGSATGAIITSGSAVTIGTTVYATVSNGTVDEWTADGATLTVSGANRYFVVQAGDTPITVNVEFEA